jgi:hypothetical protein
MGEHSSLYTQTGMDHGAAEDDEQGHSVSGLADRGMDRAIGSGVLGRIENPFSVRRGKHATRANGLVQTLLHADITKVPDIIRDIEEYRIWANPLLKQPLEKAADDSREKLHASLALLPVDPGQVEYLYRRLLDAEPQEVLCIREALRDHKEKLVEPLWSVVEQPERQDQRLRAACTLAAYDPGSPRWVKFHILIANRLVAENPLFLRDWREGFKPVKDKLMGPLSSIFRDHRAERRSERSLANSYLDLYATDQPYVLADLLLDADETQFALFYPKLSFYHQRALDYFQTELAKGQPPDLTEDGKERLASRRANAAVALLRMGHPGDVWPLLKHSPDPRVRSYLIHRLAPFIVDPGNWTTW